MASVGLKIDDAAVKTLMRSLTNGTCRQAANTAASRAKSNIQAAGRMDSSAMYRGMTIQETSAPPLSTAYLVYSHEQPGAGGTSATLDPRRLRDGAAGDAVLLKIIQSLAW